MKARTLYLHIGRHKSGTSSLQHYLSKYRKALAARGIAYPKMGTGGRAAHHEIAAACHHRTSSKPPEIAELSRTLFAEIAPFERVILSSEAFQNILSDRNLNDFFGRAPAPDGLLARLFRGRSRSQGDNPWTGVEIRTICYVREFLDYASSSYAQRVQNSNLSAGFLDYCNSHFRKFSLLKFHNFWKDFSDNLAFKLFDREMLYKKDIIADFFQTIGAEMPGPDDRDDANPSISGNLLGFKLLLNSIELHEPTIYRHMSDLALSDARFRGRFAITSDQAAQLRTAYASYNQDLGNLLGSYRTPDFSRAELVGNPDSWADDLATFLDHPGLAQLKFNPAIAKADYRTIQRLVGLER